MRIGSTGCLLLAVAVGTLGTACGGSRAREIHFADEGGCWMAPSAPDIKGPKVVLTGTLSDYSLTAIQPEGCAFTFRTSTPDCAIDGARLRFSPKGPGIVRLKVTAATRSGATSAEGTLDVEVQPAPSARAPDSSSSRP